MSSKDEARSIARPSLIRPLSHQNTVEGSKSRLVQPRYSTRSSMLVSTNNQTTDTEPPRSPTKDTEETMPTRLRPRSMYQTGSTALQRAEQGEKNTLQSMRPPAPISKLPEPQTSGMGRAQSLRKPSLPSQPGRYPGSASHSRAHSVNAAGVTRRDTSNAEVTRKDTSKAEVTRRDTSKAEVTRRDTSKAEVTRRDTSKAEVGLGRPRSLVGTPTTSVRANGLSVNNVPSGGSVPGRLVGLRSTRTKTEALVSAPEPKSMSRPEEALPVHPGRRDGMSEGSKKTSRPAFTTLQQHFTPRKTGKAPTATFLHPAPIAGPQALPQEITNLQAELLQLHLLHEPCAEVCRRWELSAKRRLKAKFDEVSSLHQIMLEHEQAGQEQKNLQSLLEWSSGKSSVGLIEHVQILSEPLHELPSLVEPEGRLQRCVTEFEHWMSWVKQVRAARQDRNGTLAASRTIEGLGDSWKVEVKGLVRKLTSFARALDSLADPSPGSSLLCIVTACQSLLGGILEELQIMQMIEAEVAIKEKSWVENRLKYIARAIGTCSVDGDGDGEVADWRS